MKTNAFAMIKKWGLLAWTMLMMTILVSTMSVFAFYPDGLSTMKRVVVSTMEERGLLFSSNLLSEGGINTYTPQYKTAVNAQTNSYNVDVYLWNHTVKDAYTRYGEDIAYTLSFRLTNKKGEPLSAAAVGDREVVIEDDRGNSFTLNSGQLAYDVTDPELSETIKNKLNGTLGTNEEQDSLELRFDGDWDLDTDDNICVQVSAALNKTGGHYADLQNLGAVIGLKRVSSNNDSGWNAYLNEHRNNTDTRPVEGFDGFNIVVEGSGQADITIELNTDRYCINKNFYGTVTVTDTIVDENTGTTTQVTRTVKLNEVSYETSGTTGTLTIGANSNSDTTSYRNRYTIQLYKKGGAGYTEPGDWNFFAVKKNNAEPANWSTADVKVTIEQS